MGTELLCSGGKENELHFNVAEEETMKETKRIAENEKTCKMDGEEVILTSVTYVAWTKDFLLCRGRKNIACGLYPAHQLSGYGPQGAPTN